MVAPIDTSLPTWDMSPLFPAIDSPERETSLAKLLAMFDTLDQQISAAEALDAPAGPEVTASYEAITTLSNEIQELALRHVTFLYGFTSTDSRNNEAQARTSELMMALARARTLDNRYTAWVGTLDIDALLADSDLARRFEFALRNAQTSASHLMVAPQEELASELGLTGGNAWSTMYGQVTSQISVPFEQADGTIENLPISEIRNLATNPDRDIRKRAFEAEQAAWKLWETPIAVALNGIKGEHVVLARRRQWNSVLEEALFQNHIDRETLDAMLGAARTAFPDLRRYFDAKARLLGVEKLAFYDLFAPISTNPSVWNWEEGVEFLSEHFGSYSDTLRDLVTTAVDERWIDVGPRPGKTDGAFCMPVGDGKSRVLLNYNDSFDGVSTLAHELGHAYHNLCQADVPAISRDATPMTLAETASTFCETILRQAAITEGTEDEQLAILESSLQDSAQIVVDITSRFLFEQAVCDKRPERALSPDEFCELMLDAQRQTYGDGLDGDTLHPYMWAVKSHYYSPSAAFYNYPYMFGLLFGLGLYAQYQNDPDSFREGYDALLAATGDADAATLAARFGFDVRSADFWSGSLDVIRKDIDTFVELVDRRLGN